MKLAQLNRERAITTCPKRRAQIDAEARRLEQAKPKVTRVRRKKR